VWASSGKPSPKEKNWIFISFTLFHAFAILHGNLFRLGKVTLQELRKQIYRSLLRGSPRPFFSG